MKWKKWLENWDMTKLKVKTPFLEMEWSPSEPDKNAAWDLYIELLTRVATQSLPSEKGDEKTALESLHDVFGLTREIIRQYGRDCLEFTKIAVLVLNQLLRPFTSKWHRLSVAGAFDEAEKRQDFHREIQALQIDLVTYTRMLADMAGVEDLTQLEDRSKSIGE